MRSDSMPRPGIVVAVILFWILATLAGSAGVFYRETQVRERQALTTDTEN